MFSNFEEDTQEKDIIDMINSVVPAGDTVEEVFAFAKTGSKGAVKFRSEDALWDYMSRNKGNHKHQFRGRRIYTKAASARTKQKRRLSGKQCA